MKPQERKNPWGIMWTITHLGREDRVNCGVKELTGERRNGYLKEPGEKRRVGIYD